MVDAAKIFLLYIIAWGANPEATFAVSFAAYVLILCGAFIGMCFAIFSAAKNFSRPEARK